MGWHNNAFARKSACRNDMRESWNNFIVWLDRPVQTALVCLLDRDRTLRFASETATERFVLLDGPVQNALFCLMVR